MAEHGELDWVLEDEETGFLPPEEGVFHRREFAEIPRPVRLQVDRELRGEVFEVLHAEAVARGELPSAPASAAETSLGRLLYVVGLAGFGGVLGLAGVAIALWLSQLLTTVL